MSERILRDQIQAGDRIRVTSDFLITSIVWDQDGPGRHVFTYERSPGLNARAVINEGDKVELLERPLPPLPTERGSVVKVSSDMPRAGIWLLTEDRDGLLWVSDSGAKRTPDRLREFIESYRSRRFEVLL